MSKIDINAKLSGLKAWWDRNGPDPIYDIRVKVTEDRSPAIIIGLLAITWIAANAAPLIVRIM